MAAEIFPIFILLFESRCDSQAPYVVKQHREFGFLDVNLTGNGREMRVTFYDIDGKNKDQFTIRK